MTEPDLKNMLGLRIKTLRLERNMTQNALAMECDFEKANMSRIESGQANPTISTLFKISTALGVHIAELFLD